MSVENGNGQTKVLWWIITVLTGICMGTGGHFLGSWINKADITILQHDVSSIRDDISQIKKDIHEQGHK